MAPQTHDLVEVSDRTQFDVWASFAHYSDRVAVRDEGPMLLVRTEVPASFFNVAFVRGPVDDSAAFVAEAAAFFAERDLPWRLTGRVGVADAVGLAALDAGLRPNPTMEGMTLSPLTAAPPVLPDGVAVEMVADEAALEMNQAVCAAGFGMPIEIARALLPSSMLGAPSIAVFNAYVDGTPAATSILLITDEIAGIYNVATLPEFRRRGLGAAVTAAALAEGAKRGCTVGALQPSDAGRPVYAKLGFVPSALYLVFSTPPAETTPAGP